MKAIINEILGKFKREAEEFFEKDTVEIAQAEQYFTPRIAKAVTAMLSAYYEKKDAELASDRAGRRAAGLVVERRDDPRCVLTQLGILEFHRTYYQQKDGTYCYPVDAIAGIAAYERVSAGVSETLADTAREMSYARSSEVVTCGAVSRQTVMNKIRQSRPPLKEVVERRSVPSLHVDADEDHVHLQNGQSTIVPLISVYEGVEKHGRRGRCKNVFHISEYGKRPDALWEETLNEIERRYDLSQTKIYLHGDGAAWIKQGLEWLPNAVFVLDRYHKNKTLKASVSGIERKIGCQYEYLMRKALTEGDRDLFCSVRDSLLSRFPERAETIRENTEYLLNHFDAIHICSTDPEAVNGGATEPHVSHVLSARLSSRPMGWSKETLTKFVPMLAAGGCVYGHENETLSLPPLSKPAVSGKKHPDSRQFGKPDPRISKHLPARDGKITSLHRILSQIDP